MEERRRPFYKSLQGKVSLQMLIVALLPIAIISGLVYNSMKSSEDSADRSVEQTRSSLAEDTIGAGKASQAWSLAVDIETWIAERIGEVKGWAANGAVIEAAREGSDANSAAWTFLGDQVTRSPFFDDAVVRDEDGNKASANVSWNPLEIPMDPPSWQLAWEEGLYVTDVTFVGDEVTPLYYLEIAARVRDPMSGKHLGTVVGTMKLNPMSLGQEYASKVPGNRVVVWGRPGEDGEPKLITDSAYPDRYRSKSPTWSETEEHVIGLMSEDPRDIIQPTVDEGSDPCYVITDEAVAGYARAANDSVHIRFTEFAGLGWTVMVEQDAKDAFAALGSLEALKGDLEDNTRQMLLTLIIILIVVVIAVPVFSFFLSRSITKPIAQLSDAAEKVSMGDMSVNVEVKSDDEIGDLAESFGRMIVAVRFLTEDEDEEE